MEFSARMQVQEDATLLKAVAEGLEEHSCKGWIKEDLIR